MEVRRFLEVLHTAERLKDTTRHSYTSGGRHESVAEHRERRGASGKEGGKRGSPRLCSARRSACWW